MLSSVKHGSILRMKTKQSMERFTWDRVWLEISTHCPTLTSILQECLPPQVVKNDGALAPLCVCASILLKLRNSHVNLVQGIISILLKSGHANTQVMTPYILSYVINYYIMHMQVFRRLQKVMLSLSYPTTLRMMDVIWQRGLMKKF